MTRCIDAADAAPPVLLKVSPPHVIKLAGDGADQGVISGYASTFGPPADSFDDVIVAGAYRDTLDDHRKAGTIPAMLWAHVMSEIIGRWVELREDARGLFVRGQLNLNTTRGREAFEHLRAKDCNGLSIGYRIRPDGYRYQSDGTRLLTAIDLVEVSVVAVPAAQAARVTEVKSFGSCDDLECFLHDAGLPSDTARKVAGSGWAGLAGGADNAALADLIRRVDAARLELRSLHPHR